MLKPSEKLPTQPGTGTAPKLTEGIFTLEIPNLLLVASCEPAFAVVQLRVNSVDTHCKAFMNSLVFWLWAEKENRSCSRPVWQDTQGSAGCCWCPEPPAGLRLGAGASRGLLLRAKEMS